jgi:hypothetical protein
VAATTELDWVPSAMLTLLPKISVPETPFGAVEVLVASVVVPIKV